MNLRQANGISPVENSFCLFYFADYHPSTTWRRLLNGEIEDSMNRNSVGHINNVRGDKRKQPSLLVSTSARGGRLRRASVHLNLFEIWLGAGNVFCLLIKIRTEPETSSLQKLQEHPRYSVTRIFQPVL